MKGEPIQTNILSVNIIPNVNPYLAKELKLPEGHISLGLISTDCDDVSYVALDEATKKARVEVVYARSLYAGSSNASTKLAGEFLGIISGDSPSEVRSGLEAAVNFIKNEAHFYTANDDGSIVYFAQCISRTGSYLSKGAGVPEGTAMAYLIAPPMEAIMELDAAIKVAEVTMNAFYGPPTETNFAGGLLTGDQAACKAACQAFADAVCAVAEKPIRY